MRGITDKDGSLNARTIFIMARDIVERDAVGNFCLQLGEIYQKFGLQVKFSSDHFQLIEPMEHIVHMPRHLLLEEACETDILYYHFSIGDPFLPNLESFPGKIVLYFHNITPPEIIDSSDTITKDNCQLGYDQLRTLPHLDAVITNSNYTKSVLLEIADVKELPEVNYLPPVVNMSRWENVDVSNNSYIASKSNNKKFIYVGRIVPNKGIVQMLNLFEHLSTLEDIQLDIIGGPDTGAYIEQCRAIAERIEQSSRSKIYFHHNIPDVELKLLYSHADAAVTMSYHEGFCVPALDALYFDIPFFCAALPAVDDIFGEGKIELSRENLQKSAAVVIEFMNNQSALKKNALIRDAQRAKLAQKARDQNQIDIISSLIGGEL